MKKFLFILLIIMWIIITPTLIVTFTDYPSVKIPKGYYLSSEHYDDEGFLDFTDYCEYYYRKNGLKEIKNSRYYKKIKNEKDIKEVKEYFKDYSQWIVYRKGYKGWYKFDYKKQVKLNDYYYIENRGSKASFNDDKFINYDIYYYDVDKNTLYYFHTNI